MSYEQKYLKYKAKYANLLSQLGGKKASNPRIYIDPGTKKETTQYSVLVYNMTISKLETKLESMKIAIPVLKKSGEDVLALFDNKENAKIFQDAYNSDTSETNFVVNKPSIGEEIRETQSHKFSLLVNDITIEEIGKHINRLNLINLSYSNSIEAPDRFLVKPQAKNPIHTYSYTDSGKRYNIRIQLNSDIPDNTHFYMTFDQEDIAQKFKNMFTRKWDMGVDPLHNKTVEPSTETPKQKNTSRSSRAAEEPDPEPTWRRGVAIDAKTKSKFFGLFDNHSNLIFLPKLSTTEQSFSIGKPKQLEDKKSWISLIKDLNLETLKRLIPSSLLEDNSIIIADKKVSGVTLKNQFILTFANNELANLFYFLVKKESFLLNFVIQKEPFDIYIDNTEYIHADFGITKGNPLNTKELGETYQVIFANKSIKKLFCHLIYVLQNINNSDISNIFEKL